MDRVARARALFHDAEIEALLVSADENRRYLSGFTGSAGYLLLTQDHALLISDGRYTTQAGQQAPNWDFHLITPPQHSLIDVLKAELPKLGLQRLGFEAAHVTVTQHTGLTRELGDMVTLVPTEGLIEGLRETKDAGELALLERAIAITDHAFAQIRPLLRPTMRERDVAWEIEKALHDAGATGLAFSVIVAAGLNAAKPHARPGDDQLGVGQPVVLDFGALYQGYHGDMTRTVILGEVDEQWQRIYALVLAAQQHAATEVKVGMTGAAADALARDHFAAADLVDAFSHGLGHGVGLAIHEGPSLRRASDVPLPAGSVFSIEPGLYLPDWGGVRIEDLLLLETTGPRTLTQSSKEPLITWD
ncbi:MAG: aminopeptidase P family protein [Herpetosiphonaceae bacterium]|nr:aminopeptidase P family protein [Herpetosiphonaceae bacterium]